MYNYYFVIPDAVWYCCIIPALIIILACFLFGIIYRRKKDTRYYAYTLNYVFNIGSILICILLFPLLLGYSAAMLYIINKGLLVDVNIVIRILLIILPIIPFITLIVVLHKFIKNLKFKEIVDERIKNDEEEKSLA